MKQSPIRGAVLCTALLTIVACDEDTGPATKVDDMGDTSDSDVTDEDTPADAADDETDAETDDADTDAENTDVETASDADESDVDERMTDTEDTGDPPSDDSLCAKYGGADNVASVVQDDIIGTIAGDCRISSFFTGLTDDGFIRVEECLTIQVQELFGCPGITYEGAEASNGLPCRDMREAHIGLALTTGDFDALIEDVVAGLSQAGVDEEDIAAAAPALLGMEEDIVEEPDDADPSASQCMLGDAGAVPSTDAGVPASDAGAPSGDAGAMERVTLCDKYGGPDSVASVVQNQVIGAIAGDCRINTFFTSLSSDAFTRVNDCLVVQVQELFGCDGVAYAGAEASNGLPCRSMAEAHLGLNISQGDFDALIEDVVAGLSEAGVAEEDIAVAAPALLGMDDAIVEQPDEGAPTQDMCTLTDELGLP